MSSHTAACLGCHVLFSRVDSSSKVVGIWRPGIVLLVWHPGILAGEYVINVGENKQSDWHIASDPIKRWTGIYIRELFEFHKCLPTSSCLKLICGVRWYMLSGTSYWNVNKAAVHLPTLDLPLRPVSSKSHSYTYCTCGENSSNNLYQKYLSKHFCYL